MDIVARVRPIRVGLKTVKMWITGGWHPLSVLPNLLQVLQEKGQLIAFQPLGGPGARP